MDEMTPFYKWSKRIGAPLIRAYFRVEVRGMGNVPSTGPAILASNHTSFLDHFVVPAIVPRGIRYLAKAELFEGRVSRWLFTHWGQIPVRRGKGDEGALRTALSVLEEGHLLGIYPEGTRSPDGRLYKGHTGVARIALASGAPVVPVAMIGAFDALPKGRTLPRPHQVRVAFGPAMTFTGDPTPARCREVTDTVMEAIGALLGATPLPVYSYPSQGRWVAAAGPASKAGTPAPVCGPDEPVALPRASTASGS